MSRKKMSIDNSIFVPIAKTAPTGLPYVFITIVVSRIAKIITPLLNWLLNLITLYFINALNFIIRAILLVNKSIRICEDS
jgi:ABC-type microcin C transport system permease subunit YejE